MKLPVFTNQFQKDYDRCRKRGQDLVQIKAVMFDLICENPLDRKYNDHPLRGKHSGCRELHVAPDWLLEYRYAEEIERILNAGKS